MANEGLVNVAEDLRLYYRWLGSKRESPIVAPMATWWGPQLDRLANEHAVLVYDPRGRGRSDPRPETGGSLDDELEDLERLRRALHLEVISLIGWSYVGAVVALYAARYLQHVRRVVQVGPMVPRRDPYWAQFIADNSSRAQLPFASSASNSVWGPAIAPQLADPATAAQILGMLDLTSPHEDPAKIGAWAAKATGGQGGWDWRGEAAKVTVPVLTVHGVRDNIPLGASREWVHSFPDARLLVIEGAGHYPHFEQPDVFVAALGTFFDGEWPADAIT
jgi:pimeloyl-ACP methyl ester carboxylesterase